jgi:DNA-binding MarR family transcriptional regulator
MPEQVDNINQCAADAPAGDEVLELVHQVMHRYRSHQLRGVRASTQELTHMDSRVLAFFGRCPGATQSDLVQHTGRDKAQLARLIKGLRERGWLVGEADPADRRSIHLRLTPEGETVHRALRAHASTVQAQAIAGLTPTEHTELLRLLQHVQRNLA